MAETQNEESTLHHKSKDELIDELVRLERKHRTKTQIIEDIQTLERRISGSQTASPASSHKVQFKPNSVIYNEDEAGDAVYILLNGQVEFQKTNNGQASKTLAKIGEGEMFGDLALFDNRPRAATAIATKQTEVYRVTRDDFLDQLSSVDPAIRLITESLTKRLRSLVDDLIHKKK